MQSSTVKTAAIRSLRDLGYHDDLFENDWTPHDLVPNGNGSVSVPTVAFWGRPFDQFRSAVSIVDRNGLPDYQLAHQVARKAWTHVAVCGDLDMSLWFFGAEDIQLVADRITAEAIPHVFQDNAVRFDRLNVARQKMRLRQYALYETDPSGHAFADWAIKPSAEQVRRSLSRILSSTVSAGRQPWLTRDEPRVRRDALVRWIFRVLSLRVGIDREWEITQWS